MEKTLKYRENNHLLKELSETLKRQTEIEKKIIRARLDGKSLSEMDEKEQRVLCDNIIFKCSAFTGCELPATDYFADILSESILAFFMELGYSDLTLNEMILALSLNCTHQQKLPGNIELPEVVFSGKGANISYLSKVVGRYMILRNYLDRRFQNLIDGYE